MIAMCGFVAFAVDLGYLCVVRTQLQRTADAAALAASRELYRLGDDYTAVVLADVNTQAGLFSAQNEVTGLPPALAGQDVVIGYLADPTDPAAPIVTSGDPLDFNAVRVIVRRTADQNGQAPLFFARVFGLVGIDTQAEATVVIYKSFSGFQQPPDGTNLPILPIALDEQTWNDLLAGVGPDNFSYDPETGSVTSGSDDRLEIDLYPTDTGSPGNRGTVNIGTNNNSTAHLGNQIRNGVTAADLAFHGGSLDFDAYGELQLGADPGLSAAIKADLTAIIGEPKIIPIFRALTGNGNNAVYTIVKWVGIRVVYVKLTGNDKHVFVQPAKVVTRGGTAAVGYEDQSDYVYSPSVLAR